MALPSIKNSVGMAVSGTPGTETITLGAALSGGYQTAATAYGANANIDIRIEEGDTWEVCRDCTYTHIGTTVTRGTLEDGSSGASTRVAFTTAARVYVVESAVRIHNLNNVGIVIVENNGSTAQSIGATSFVKVSSALATEVVDNEGWWDETNKKFLPTRAGKYLVSCAVSLTQIALSKTMIASIYKNGAEKHRIDRKDTGMSASTLTAGGSCIIEMNGSTDYLELYIYNGDASSRNTEVDRSCVWFMAMWVSV